MSIHTKTSLFLSFLMACQIMVGATGAQKPLQLKRIRPSDVKAKITDIEKSIKRNTYLRYTLLGVAGAAFTGLMGYNFYNWFIKKEPSEPVVTIEELQKDVNKEDMSPAEMASNQGKIVAFMKKHFLNDMPKWYDFGYSKLPFPIRFVVSTVGSIYVWNSFSSMQRYVNNVFKARTVKWFVTMQTRLGTFWEFHDVNGIPHEKFNEGEILRGLRINAEYLDSIDENTDEKEKEQILKIICSSYSSLIKEIPALIAFMKHTIDVKMNKHERKSEIESFAGFMRVDTNAFGKDLETMIAAKQANSQEKTTAVKCVTMYLNKLQHNISEFARIAQEEDIAF